MSFFFFTDTTMTTFQTLQDELPPDKYAIPSHKRKRRYWYLFLFVLVLVGGLAAITTRLLVQQPSSKQTNNHGDDNVQPGNGNGTATVSPTPTANDDNSTGPSASPAPNSEPTLQYIFYRPGTLLAEKEGLLLSQGLDVKVIARTGEYVTYKNGQNSSIVFHKRPDFGATFAVPNDSIHTNLDTNGWVYAINCEAKEEGEGGVGALEFDQDGNVIHYNMVLTNTTMNCGGGRSPWNTWLSCEEKDDKSGHIYQVDPFGVRKSEITTLGQGRFENFAFDVRNKTQPRFFATEDRTRGALRRFTPHGMLDWKNDPWSILHTNGTLDYLVLHPENNTFEWVSDWETAKDNAKEYYPESEGMDVNDGFLYFVCKGIKMLTILNLDDFTYTRESTEHGLFDGQPDQLQRILSDGDKRDILYFTEEHGDVPGIHGRDPDGRFFTILESAAYRGETTGLAFSPNGKHIYFCFQEIGTCFDVWRTDGMAFFGTTLNVKYHSGPLSSR